MKKKTKILIAIIIAIALIVTIAILGINELSKYHIYTATIVNIEGEKIIIDDVTTKYQVYTKDVIIKDNKGNTISNSDLNIGDNIKIITKDGFEKAIAMTPKLLQNVKQIKVLENKSEDSTQQIDMSGINNTTATMKAVVVKTNEKSFLAMGIKDTNGLYSIGYANQDNTKLKQGQEILIYFDGGVLESYPGQIHNVEKIEIIKEKSDIEIPESILKYCYSSRNNVTVSVSELTSTGISFTIKDTNELQYNYSNAYSISKKVKNKDYTGIGYQIGENTGNSTAGYTRNRT